MELRKQKNYQQAFDLAVTSLGGMNLEERGRNAKTIYENTHGIQKIIVRFFSEPYTIYFPQMEFYSPSKRAISLVTRLLLLHYLIRADGSPLTGRWVGYKDLPGGLLYASVFERRVTAPLKKKFGESAKSFKDAGIALGGIPQEVGDASFTLWPLPRVPLQYVFWRGDEEFPPHIQLLFDASVDHYLSLEDIVVLGQMATGRLIHRLAAS